MRSLKIPKDPLAKRISVLGHYVQIVMDNQKTARPSCPDCGDMGVLDDHQISTDGTVTPSVVCTACNFHGMVILAGWESK